MNIFRIEYQWVEDEHDETLVAKDVEAKQFEEDLLNAKRFAESLLGKEIKKGDYLGKGYSVEVLPEFYAQIVWYLVNKKDYIECDYLDRISYIIEDERKRQIFIKKKETTVVWKDL